MPRFEGQFGDVEDFEKFPEISTNLHMQLTKKLFQSMLRRLHRMLLVEESGEDLQEDLSNDDSGDTGNLLNDSGYDSDKESKEEHFEL